MPGSERKVMAKAARKPKTGTVVRISRELVAHLGELKQPGEGYDALLRRQFGLPSRNGHEQKLRNYFVIDTADDLIVKRTIAEARGEAIILAVKRGQRLIDKKRKESVLKVREVAT
jgi:hypothetical protein